MPAARAATTIAATGSLVERPARFGSTHTAVTDDGLRSINSRTGPAPYTTRSPPLVTGGLLGLRRRSDEQQPADPDRNDGGDREHAIEADQRQLATRQLDQ